ncbi:MAG: rod shape-determining protein [Clostridia bacterium]|nr:rod shape-determining protein [Clostridia bacterium]
MGVRFAIDVGSSKTAIYQVGGGVVLSEPSIVAVSSNGKKTVNTVGTDAKKLLGKSAKGTTVFSPVFEGEIEKENAARLMLMDFCKKVEIGKFGTRAEVLVTVPCGTENPAIRRFSALFADCGVTDVRFVESPIAAALGLNAPVTEHNPCFVIDMGGGITNIAAVSLDGVIAGVSANIGGDNIDNMLIDFVEETYRLRIGSQTAERIKCEIASLLPDDTTSLVINGRDLDGGYPRSMQLQAKDITELIKLYVNKINEIASMVMAKLPPEVSAEVRRTGIYLAGGLSKIIGLEEYFHNEFSLNVRVNPDPELAAVIGAGRIMLSDKLYKKLSFKV